MKKDLSIWFLILIILFTTFFLVFIYISYYLFKDEEVYLHVPDVKIKKTLQIATTTNVVKNEYLISKLEPVKLHEVFTEGGDMIPVAFESISISGNQSNIVGYIGRGAFVLNNIPGWIIGHWIIEDVDSVGSISFVAKPEYASSLFSSIDIKMGTTTKTFNAKLLYDIEFNEEINFNNLKQINVGSYLNYKRDMRIYSINKIRGDRSYNFYYMDGNDKTAIITFNTDVKYANGTSLKLLDDFIKYMGTGRDVILDE